MVPRGLALVALMASIATPGSKGFSFTSNSLSTSTVARKPTIRTSTLYMGPPIDPSAPITEQMGEGSRKYRRTVYTHADWVKHRGSDRFVNNIKTLFNSGIYKQVSREVYATTAVAIFVFLWNMIAGGYTDLAGVQHGPLLTSPYVQVIGLPLTAFTLVSPSLGLLLGKLRRQLNNHHFHYYETHMRASLFSSTSIQYFVRTTRINDGTRHASFGV